jgi:malate dehydrogenase (oxaloacetate-decarboxylating)
MASSWGLQDRFDRHTVFELRVRVGGGGSAAERLLAAARQVGAVVADVRLAGADGDGEALLYDLRVFAAGDEQMAACRRQMAGLEGVSVVTVRDLALDSHRGGACEMRSRAPIRSNTDLRIVYTPGVARVCRAVQDDPARARELTNLANKVAVVTNGTAVLGLGDIGPLAALPVMEGKAAIFWEFARISAEPVLVDAHDPEAFVDVVQRIACGFGAIQIEDVKAPECFHVTEELDRRLPVPVFHDDQHGTATIVLAGLYSALKRTGRRIEEMTCAISGCGAAGTAIADLLLRAGVPDVVLCDSRGALYRGRSENMNPAKAALAERTNQDNVRGDLADAMRGRALFVGVSRPNLVSADMVRSMAAGPIVFALANPVSEIAVADAYAAGASVAADGRMMNNALAYPGIFRGALDAAAPAITVEMMQAAAEALADAVAAEELMPEMMDPATHAAVAEAVRRTAAAAP